MKAIVLLLAINGDNANVRNGAAHVRLGPSIDYAVWIDAGVWVRGPVRNDRWSYRYYSSPEAAMLAERLPSAEVCDDAIALGQLHVEYLTARQACDFAHQHWHYHDRIVDTTRRVEAWRSLRRLRLAIAGQPQSDLADDVRILREAVGPRFEMPTPIPIGSAR